jgi:hypothetical protein
MRGAGGRIDILHHICLISRLGTLVSTQALCSSHEGCVAAIIIAWVNYHIWCTMDFLWPSDCAILQQCRASTTHPLHII